TSRRASCASGSTSRRIPLPRWQACSRRSRSAGSPILARSATPSCSCSATRPRRSPARRSRSIAVRGPALQRRALSPEELRARFGAVYTAALTDVLDGLGRRRQTLPPEVVPLEPGRRLAGPAFAVEGRTNHAIDPEVSIRRILEMLGSVPGGHVAVYEPGDTTCAHFGELSATSLQVHGVAGVVINGGCRDVDLVRASGLPVF